MSVKIGLISDVHATPDPLREALAIFSRQGIETILCAGDIAGYGSELEATVALLVESGCRAILGNHDLWHLQRRGAAGCAAESYLRSLPGFLELTCAGRSLYLVHASPPASLLDGIHLLDEDGAVVWAQRERWSAELRDFPGDVLVVGHTHQIFAERLGRPLVVNPGSTRFNHSCAVLQLPELAVEILPLGGREPLPAWNWRLEWGGR